MFDEIRLTNQNTEISTMKSCVVSNEILQILLKNGILQEYYNDEL